MERLLLVFILNKKLSHLDGENKNKKLKRSVQLCPQPNDKNLFNVIRYIKHL